jgi:hypothetical protein
MGLSSRRAAGAVALIVLLSGCSAETASPVLISTPAGRTASDPVEGSGRYALAFDLPARPKYRAVGRRVADDGAVIRQWRAKIAGSRWYCVVIAGEQPHFRGAFPAGTLAAFRANRDPSGVVQLNEAIAPIPGTVAGVSQRSSYPISAGHSDTRTGQLLVRQYLTGDGTLISLNVAGPASDADRCRLADIVQSLRVSSPSDQSPPDQSSVPQTQRARAIGEETP